MGERSQMHYFEAIARPFQDSRKFAIGSLLFMIPFVNIITSFFGYGYLFVCAKTAMRKQFKLPEWERWEDLFVRGLIISIIGTLYFLPALVLWLVFLLAAIWSVMSGEAYGRLAIGVGLMMSGIFALLTAYIVPSAILNYAKENRFRSAFSLRRAFKGAFTSLYFSAWGTALLYSSFLLVPSVFLMLVSMRTVVLPFVIGGVLSFVLGVTSVTIIGDAYGQID
jgi:hypothetical protein